MKGWDETPSYVIPLQPLQVFQRHNLAWCFEKVAQPCTERSIVYVGGFYIIMASSSVHPIS